VYTFNDKEMFGQNIANLTYTYRYLQDYDGDVNLRRRTAEEYM
jgi:hypothetical protein